MGGDARTAMRCFGDGMHHTGAASCWTWTCAMPLNSQTKLIAHLELPAGGQFL